MLVPTGSIEPAATPVIRETKEKKGSSVAVAEEEEVEEEVIDTVADESDVPE